MRVLIIGAGAVGARAARQLISVLSVDDLVIVERNVELRDAVVESLGPPARAGAEADFAPEQGDVVVLAAPVAHRPLAERALERGAHVVSTADAADDVKALLDLDAEARERRLHIVVGAGFSPGLGCVLAAHAATRFDRIDEIHIAKVGTGGPACARQLHRALGEAGLDWHDGAWSRRRGGSGRTLCWFPDPVRGVDCYRGAFPEPLLLTTAFPTVRRVTARAGANRRDRLTARLPMLRRPHPEGGLGALRVEVRGSRGAALDEYVLGAIDRPGVAAGTVAAMAAVSLIEGSLSRHGAGGLAELVEPTPFLAALADRGVKAAVFEGSMGGGQLVDVASGR
ncbi:MAG: NAD(P)-binding domain-containing protein [Acidimicrobiia bacterium]|nr:NAD(P)-binding domain-containing protein [Acidimicrobiia bacterium]